MLHSIYTVLKLRSYVHGPLWAALRESNPYTAVTTLDYHLERLQWEDCYLPALPLRAARRPDAVRSHGRVRADVLSA